jgi:hypothetical protein
LESIQGVQAILNGFVWNLNTPVSTLLTALTSKELLMWLQRVPFNVKALQTQNIDWTADPG